MQLTSLRYKNRVEITPNNILGRVAHPLTVSFRDCLRQMVNSGQYIASLRWILSPPMSIPRAETVWKIATNPSMVDILDIEEVFFDPWQKRRYFDEKKPKEVRHKPPEDKRSQAEVPCKQANKGKVKIPPGSNEAPSSSRCPMADVAEWQTRMQKDLVELLAFTGTKKEEVEELARLKKTGVRMATKPTKREGDISAWLLEINDHSIGSMADKLSIGRAMILFAFIGSIDVLEDMGGPCCAFTSLFAT
ncbi:hypothetical protein R1sor_007814 [Riccia sorocarpa]|uniref:Uncharacterized protein n=1 Tax=Riccia sorocarpa TaxID=122646 RepID=A0ABD3HRX1_9MARC